MFRCLAFACAPMLATATVVAEPWGDLAGGSWRLHAEYAETACDFLSDPPEFGCACTNSIDTSGYRYRGRVLGHSLADTPATVRDLALVHESSHPWGTIATSLRYADGDATGPVAVEGGVRGFVTWRCAIR